MTVCVYVCVCVIVRPCVCGPRACQPPPPRRLSGGAFALGFVNNGPEAATVTCDAACFASVGLTSGAVVVRDLWAHADVAKLAAPYSFSAPVNGSGFAALFKLTPV